MARVEKSFTVGNWTVEVSLDRILRDGESINLRPQVMELLAHLAQQPGEVVSADELREALWPQRIVTDASIYTCVAELRRALDSDPARKAYVETIPKRGYRLVAPVTTAATARPADPGRSVRPWRLVGYVAMFAAAAVLATWSFGRIYAPALTSVALLPFVNMSGDASQEFFADGLTEEILNSLARHPDLRVTARTSAFYFKNRNIPVPDIARELMVENVVEGSIRREGDQIRITAQLNRGSDGTHIWSDQYDYTLTGIFELQEMIAADIVEALDIVLDEEEREAMFEYGTRDVDAYLHFLEGRQLLYEWYRGSDHEVIWKANRLFDAAIEADPRFALAYSRRGDVLLQFLDGVIPSPVSPLESDASMTPDWALREFVDASQNVAKHAQNPEIALVGQINAVLYSRDWTTLPRLVGRIDPVRLAAISDSAELFRVGLAMLILGYADEALVLAENRIKRNPLSWLAYTEAWRAAYVSGDLDKANAFLDRGMALGGPLMFLEHARLLMHVSEGEYDEALRLAGDEEWGVGFLRTSITAYVHAAKGDYVLASKIMDDLPDAYPGDVILAMAHREIGNIETARRMIAAIDASPSTATQFAYLFTYFGGKLPIDPSWAPNFSKRLAEAGVDPMKILRAVD